MCICFRCKRECSRLFINKCTNIHTDVCEQKCSVYKEYSSMFQLNMLAYAKFINSLFNDKKKTEQNFRVFYLFFHFFL